MIVSYRLHLNTTIEIQNKNVNVVGCFLFSFFVQVVTAMATVMCVSIMKPLHR